MNRMIKIKKQLSRILWVTVTMALLLLTPNSQAALKAYLNQNTVFVGDPVELTIESDTKLSAKPDLTPLAKDFQVQSTGQSTNFSMVNGNMSYTQSWKISLLPKRKGQLTIPALTVGSEKTQPVTLNVADMSPQAVAKASQHVRLEAIADIGATMPYVQQQIPYTLRLYTDDTVVSGDMYEPQIENAVIERISRDKQYSVVQNGKRLNVLERRYVISPEKSGKLLIPPALFKGEQSPPRQTRKRQDDFFNDPFFDDFFRPPGKPISTRSDSIEVDVQPIPTSYTGKHWLPAEDVVITDSWDKQLPTFRVGEPVVRTLTWQTKGLTGSQIPEMALPAPEKMRMYPDQVKTETKTDGKTVFGLRHQDVSYIPNVAGKITIPAMQVDWWNVQTGKQEAFTIPAREVEVLPGVDGSTSVAAPEQTAAGKDQTASANNPSQSTASATRADAEEQPGGRWWLWFLVVTGLAVLAYRLIKRFSNRPANHRKPQQVDKTVGKKVAVANTGKLMGELKNACQKHDKKQVAKLLLDLAQTQWPDDPPRNLGALADRLKSGATEVRGLDRQLYAGENQSASWDCRALWDAVKDGLVVKPDSTVSAQQGDAGLTELYPHGRTSKG